MNAQRSANPAEPIVEGERIRVVRPGYEDRTLPQGVMGVDAISRRTVGSEGIFMARHRVPPGVHSDLHSHTNCETVVYILRGRAYAGEDMDEYVEAGPGDFACIPANLAHLVGCPADSEPLEYVAARDAPGETVVTLREAADLPIDPDGKMRDA
ncbi:MAG: cupin domain-containing protein [Rubrobacteraceae bacterium]